MASYDGALAVHCQQQQKNEKRQHVSGKRGYATGAVAQRWGKRNKGKIERGQGRKRSSVLQRETRGTQGRVASNAIKKAAHTNHWRQFRISSALHGVIERAYIKTRSNQISRVTIWPLFLPANSWNCLRMWRTVQAVTDGPMAHNWHATGRRTWSNVCPPPPAHWSSVRSANLNYGSINTR